MLARTESYRYERKFLVPADACTTIELGIKLNPGVFSGLYPKFHGSEAVFVFFCVLGGVSPWKTGLGFSKASKWRPTLFHTAPPR